MKNVEEQQFSENLSITLSSNSVREYSVSIPVDLLIDILSRVVSVKSIARFRCVSKFWESILGRSDFTELFVTKSLTRPRLLFAFEVNGWSYFFSSPQPQNPDDNSYLLATPYNFPYYFPTGSAVTSAPSRGLVFLQRGKKVRVIFNPITGESITLPKVKATGFGRSIFGFDPISKQFKVLCMAWSRYGTPNTHRILTLETGKRLWRTIQDPILPHYVCLSEICINGVLYYQADRTQIVCFDFRFEKFSFIKLDEEMINPYLRLTLFNYKGKLGAHQDIADPWWRWPREKFALWVLEDTGKHRWSKRICQPPPLRGNIINKNRFVGMTSTGEIVFSPYAGNLSNFCIFYYNIERNTVTRINIQGFEAFGHHHTFVHTFLESEAYVSDDEFKSL